jgi:hypothetical protein
MRPSRVSVELLRLLGELPGRLMRRTFAARTRSARAAKVTTRQAPAAGDTASTLSAQPARMRLQNSSRACVSTVSTCGLQTRRARGRSSTRADSTRPVRSSRPRSPTAPQRRRAPRSRSRRRLVARESVAARRAEAPPQAAGQRSTRPPSRRLPSSCRACVNTVRTCLRRTRRARGRSSTRAD